MQIIQELRAGTVHFGVDETGNENFSTRPPTALNLKASRVIEELVQVAQGLERANQTLAEQLEQTTGELNAQRSLLQKFMADAELTRAGTVPADPEATAAAGAETVATETNQAPTAT